MASVSLNVNEKKYQIEVDPTTPLLWVLRDSLGLTGTKYGCGIGKCGACTVHFNGVAVRSCSIPVVAAASAKVFTIEGLSEDGSHPVQKAWVENNVAQCGYCQAGQIMAAAALLKNNPKPTEEDIDLNMTNICRCCTYNKIKETILEVAKNS